MPWNSVSPDGTKSVKQNTVPMQQNTAYTEATVKKDHYFNDGVDQDGHHRFVQTEATNDADKSLQTNATLATAMDLAFFSRFKTPTESTAQQDAQPYAISQNSTATATSVMQILGIRACAVFNAAGGVVTLVYSHNVTSVSKIVNGTFQLNFTNALPSNDYLVFGGGIKDTNDGGAVYYSVKGANSVNAAKSTTRVIGNIRDNNGVLSNPIQGWVVCFGG